MNTNKHEFGKSGREKSSEGRFTGEQNTIRAVLTDNKLKTIEFEMCSKKFAQKTRKFRISNTETRRKPKSNQNSGLRLLLSLYATRGLKSCFSSGILNGPD